jgi:pimeloyl-ACP methyl ester carboxylesterase
MPETGLDDLAVDSLEAFDLGGSRQWALIRGRSPTAPGLLLIQAGPGFPMIHEAAAHERQLGLEQHFRVVYWDQRGTGRSYDAGANGAVTVEDLVADVRAMIRATCERLGVSSIHVVGLSIGGSLALLAAGGEPALIRSLVCVGVDVNLLESERFAYAFALEEAQRRGARKAQRALRAIGEPPHDGDGQFMTRVKWVANFGGVHRRKTFGALLRTTVARLWTSPHYSLLEMVRALRAIGATQSRVLPALRGFDLFAHELKVAAPLALFQGRHDVVAPPSLAAGLAARLGATLVWFEESAHMPHEEEPRRFFEELLRFTSR